VIVLDRNGARFNHRVGGAIFRTGSVLLQTSDDIDCWVVPGGRVEMLESAEEALAREIPEDAYALSSVAAELRISQVVDAPNWTVTAFFPLAVFATAIA